MTSQRRTESSAISHPVVMKTPFVREKGFLGNSKASFHLRSGQAEESSSKHLNGARSRVCETREKRMKNSSRRLAKFPRSEENLSSVFPPPPPTYPEMVGVVGVWRKPTCQDVTRSFRTVLFRFKVVTRVPVTLAIIMQLWRPFEFISTVSFWSFSEAFRKNFERHAETRVTAVTLTASLSLIVIAISFAIDRFRKLTWFAPSSWKNVVYSMTGESCSHNDRLRMIISLIRRINGLSVYFFFPVVNTIDNLFSGSPRRHLLAFSESTEGSRKAFLFFRALSKCWRFTSGLEPVPVGAISRAVGFPRMLTLSFARISHGFKRNRER